MSSLEVVVIGIWRWFEKDRRVAFLELDGILTEGKIVSSDSPVLELLNKVEQQKIKALVVRINSPGGTVGASQELFGELRRLAQKHQVKVVASMGDVAASGGVYVAMAADYIVAQPGTVTGSIGVLIKSGNVHKLMHKLGIATHTIKSGQYKDILGMDKPLTEEERALLQTTTDDTHEQFIQAVAEQRRLPVAQVKTFADGRIFTGRQALALGLVDELGGLQRAIEKARELAGLDMTGPAKLLKVKRKKSFWQRLLTRQSGTGLLDAWDSNLAFCNLPMWLAPFSDTL